MHWTGKIEPIAFTLFGRDVAWYGIIITSSMLIGLLISIKLVKKLKLTSDDLLEMFLVAIPIAIIGARLGYVLFHTSYFFDLNHPFGWNDFINVIAVWDGGLTITTGAPFGILGGFLWAKWRKIDFLYLTDNIVFVVLLCQAIGRWGNFFNQELYGQKVLNPSMQFFPYAVFISNRGAWFQATFFYEGVGNIIGFVLLYLLSRRLKVKGAGILSYIVYYFTVRSIMESMKTGGIVNGIPYGMIACIIVTVLAASALAWLIIYTKKKQGRIWYMAGIPLDEYKSAKLIHYEKEPEKAQKIDVADDNHNDNKRKKPK
jgi:phosphatidylglycerol:prolipoprotein diacylglycerol transferase